MFPGRPPAHPWDGAGGAACAAARKSAGPVLPPTGRGSLTPMHYVSHLEAAIDGTVLPFGTLANLHNGRPIWVRYHLDRVVTALRDAVERARGAR